MIAFERNENLGVTLLTQKELNRALMLDLSLDCKDQGFQNLFNLLFKSYQQASSKQRAHQAKHQRTFGQILLNLIRCHQMGQNFFLVFPQDNDHYKNDRYNPLKITRQISIEIKSWFLKGKYLKGVSGISNKNGNGMITRIRPTDKLKAIFTAYTVDQFRIVNHPRAEIIFLKDKKVKAKAAKYINYKRCAPQVNQSRKAIEQYNALMDTTNINCQGKRLPPSYFYIYRVFNNRNWLQGGRYYGSFSQMSKKTKKGQINRTKLLINGNAVVEHDFSYIHPNILYSRMGKMLSNDPYLPKGYKKKYRPFIKAVFNILINCSGKKSAHGAAINEANKNYAKLKINSFFISKLITDLETTHALIKRYFYSGEGLKLQYEDSRIATQIIATFVNQGRPIIPFHDSFIVESKYSSHLKSIMSSESKAVLGFSIPSK